VSRYEKFMLVALLMGMANVAARPGWFDVLCVVLTAVGFVAYKKEAS
jgi:hypothetical protein